MKTAPLLNAYAECLQTIFRVATSNRPDATHPTPATKSLKKDIYDNKYAIRFQQSGTSFAAAATMALSTTQSRFVITASQLMLVTCASLGSCHSAESIFSESREQTLDPQGRVWPAYWIQADATEQPANEIDVALIQQTAPSCDIALQDIPSSVRTTIAGSEQRIELYGCVNLTNMSAQLKPNHIAFYPDRDLRISFHNLTPQVTLPEGDSSALGVFLAAFARSFGLLPKTATQSNDPGFLRAQRLVQSSLWETGNENFRDWLSLQIQDLQSSIDEANTANNWVTRLQLLARQKRWQSEIAHGAIVAPHEQGSVSLFVPVTTSTSDAASAAVLHHDPYADRNFGSPFAVAITAKGHEEVTPVPEISAVFVNAEEGSITLGPNASSSPNVSHFLPLPPEESTQLLRSQFEEMNQTKMVSVSPQDNQTGELPTVLDPNTSDCKNALGQIGYEQLATQQNETEFKEHGTWHAACDEQACYARVYVCGTPTTSPSDFWPLSVRTNLRRRQIIEVVNLGSASLWVGNALDLRFDVTEGYLLDGNETQGVWHLAHRPSVQYDANNFAHTVSLNRLTDFSQRYGTTFRLFGFESVSSTSTTLYLSGKDLSLSWQATPSADPIRTAFRLQVSEHPPSANSTRIGTPWANPVAVTLFEDSQGNSSNTSDSPPIVAQDPTRLVSFRIQSQGSVNRMGVVSLTSTCQTVRQQDNAQASCQCAFSWSYRRDNQTGALMAPPGAAWCASADTDSCKAPPMEMVWGLDGHIAHTPNALLDPEAPQAWKAYERYLPEELATERTCVRREVNYP